MSSILVVNKKILQNKFLKLLKTQLNNIQINMSIKIIFINEIHKPKFYISLLTLNILILSLHTHRQSMEYFVFLFTML